MVFLLQNTQNRESAAVQAKLDEIIRSLENAENRFIELETRDDEEIAELRRERNQSCEALTADEKVTGDASPEIRPPTIT